MLQCHTHFPSRYCSGHIHTPFMIIVIVYRPTERGGKIPGPQFLQAPQNVKVTTKISNSTPKIKILKTDVFGRCGQNYSPFSYSHPNQYICGMVVDILLAYFVD